MVSTDARIPPSTPRKELYKGSSQPPWASISKEKTAAALTAATTMPAHTRVFLCCMVFSTLMPAMPPIMVMITGVTCISVSRPANNAMTVLIIIPALTFTRTARSIPAMAEGIK